jgi:hypothetical protein
MALTAILFIHAMAHTPANAAADNTLAATARSAFAENPRIIGITTRVQGQAWFLQEGKTHPLTTGTAIPTGSTLQTGENARLQVMLKDESTLTLGENAFFVVDEFLDDLQPAPSAGLKLLQGAFVFAGGITPTDKRPFLIKTPVATIGIRGTSVWGGKVNNTFGVLLLEGNAIVSTATGTITLNTPMQGTFINQKGTDQKAAFAPNSPNLWPKATIDAAVATVSFAE